MNNPQRLREQMQAAVTYHQTGRLRDAEDLYRQILKKDPQRPEVLHWLGLLLHQSGRTAEGIGFLKRAREANPTDASCRNNLGNMLRQQGDLPAAIEAYRAAIELQPDHVNALFNLGTILQDQGDTEPAIECFQKLVQLSPGEAEAWDRLGAGRLEQRRAEEALKCFDTALSLAPELASAHYHRGNALKDQGELQGAAQAYRSAIARRPDYAEAWNNLGTALLTQGELKEAAQVYRRALEINPDYSMALFNLAGVYLDQCDFSAAERAYTEALALEPERAQGHRDLGIALLHQGRADAAIDACRAAVALAPDDAEAHYWLGSALKFAGHSEVAIEEFRETLRIEPGNAVALNSLGHTHLDLGRSETAAKCYEQALELEPALSQAHLNIANSRRFTSPDEEAVRRITALLARDELAPQAQIELHFALGKIFDDCGLYDKAFKHYRKANRMQRDRVSFDRDEHQTWVGRALATFSKDFLAGYHGGSPSELPIFIVGMPRSGTTLVEQIISSHSRVHGAGELAYFHELARRLPRILNTSDEYPECALRTDGATAFSLAEEHLRSLTSLGGAVPHVTDKMPTNYYHLGMIAMLFPRARIIHCRRDPLDVCLSIYFQSFQFGHFYSYDLSDIAFVYNQYAKVMAHWCRVLPVSIFEVDYEELVADQERVTRAMIDYCGLPWEDECLAFHKTERAVATASHWQVRQPIYRRSARRWKNYERFLGELKQEQGYADQAG